MFDDIDSFLGIDKLNDTSTLLESFTKVENEIREIILRNIIPINPLIENNINKTSESQLAIMAYGSTTLDEFIIRFWNHISNKSFSTKAGEQLWEQIVIPILKEIYPNANFEIHSEFGIDVKSKSESKLFQIKAGEKWANSGERSSLEDSFLNVMHNEQKLYNCYELITFSSMKIKKRNLKGNKKTVLDVSDVIRNIDSNASLQYNTVSVKYLINDICKRKDINIDRIIKRLFKEDNIVKLPPLNISSSARDEIIRQIRMDEREFFRHLQRELF